MILGEPQERHGDGGLQPAPVNGFGRDAVVYGLGVVVARLVSFLMLPIYTRYLTPADYGALQVLQMTLDVTAILLSAGLTSGVMRFYLKARDAAERNAVISTAFLLLSGLNAIGTVLLQLGAPWVAALALSGTGAGGATLVRIVSITFLLEAGLAMPLLLLQVRRRPGWYLVASLSKLVLQLSLNILLVVVWGLGVEGVLIGTLLASAAVGSVLTLWMVRETGLRFSRAAMRDLRRFGVPYQIATAGTFILTFGDRFFLETYHGLGVVGLYGLAYQFGFLLSGLGPQPFFRAWSPQRLALSTEPRVVRDEAYARSFLQLNLVQISLAVGIALFIRPLLALMSAPEFHGAADLVPVILAAFVVQVWTDAVAIGIEVSEQTRFASFATWISVAAILILYAALIPPLAGMGAAVATLLCYALRFGFTYHWSQRLWPVTWHWTPNLRLAGYAFVCVLGDQVTAAETTVVQIAVGMALGGAYLVVVLLDPLGVEVRRLVGSVLSSSWAVVGGMRFRGGA